ncbi:tyrosine-type recombinase/integrase [Vibrio coralliirubri]|uniref:tyrosine-type recombinase/integrase n=1 Tax=Vibrio coralliirubri TaxID=1516159 RepID=UPI002284026C|nr:tyrosine-type recombinase/integrase [Vibrio coralliirubri]MCY9861182.1 tyrosine-type recombinase/integrase [Vibrio coralliirubri]
MDNDFGFVIPSELVEFEEITETELTIECQATKSIAVANQPSQLITSAAARRNPDFVSPAMRYITSLDAKSSQATNINILNNIAKSLGFADLKECPWEEMNYDVIQLILRKLKDRELAPATINLYLNAIKQTLQHAFDDELIDIKTLSRVKRIKPVRGERVSKGRKVESEEIRALLETCRNRELIRDMRDAALILSMRAFGLRRSEVTDLKIENLNLNSRQLKILGKGNKERIVGVPDQIVPILQNWIKRIHSQDWKNKEPVYLFMPIHKTGKLRLAKLSAGAIRYILHQRIEMTGIEKFAPHDMRRTFATGHLENNVEMSDVQKLMGHSDIRTTQKYDLRDRSRLFDISKGMTVF